MTRVWIARAVLACLAGAPAFARADEPSSTACLGITAGEEVWSGHVSARTGKEVRAPLTGPGPWWLVVEGVFSFSSTGRQDALRRWHEPFNELEPLCVGCGLHPQEASIALTFDGKTQPPARECAWRHAYAYLLESQGGRSVAFRINDAKWFGDPRKDNEGGLTLRIFRASPADPLVSRDQGDRRLGVAVGRPGEEKRLGTGTSAVEWPVPSDAPSFVEISGVIATGPGIEQDYRYRWNHGTHERAEDTLVRMRCQEVQEVAADPSAHRYLLRVAGCGSTLRLDLAIRRVLGAVRVRPYAAP